MHLSPHYLTEAIPHLVKKLQKQHHQKLLLELAYEGLACKLAPQKFQKVLSRNTPEYHPRNIVPSSDLVHEVDLSQEFTENTRIFVFQGFICSSKVVQTTVDGIEHFEFSLVLDLPFLDSNQINVEPFLISDISLSVNGIPQSVSSADTQLNTWKASTTIHNLKTFSMAIQQTWNSSSWIPSFSKCIVPSLACAWNLSL